MGSTSSIGSKLSYLASVGITTNQNEFDNPYDMGEPISSADIEAVVKATKEEKKDKKKKGDKFARVIEQSEKLIKDVCDDESIFEFDDYISNYFGVDEDVTLRNNLIGMGRKYNRDSSVSPETAEISKVFSANEKALGVMMEETNKDKVDIQKDINYLRTSRTKSYKDIAELINAKNQVYNVSLQILKESNNIKKLQIDLQTKAAAKKAETEDSNVASSKALSSLFGLGRNNILSSVGGYTTASGALAGDEKSTSPSKVIYDDDDDTIQKKYFANNGVESDGDKFLKYEKSGVEYVLLLSEEGEMEGIIAEDRDGNIISDYPMPSNIDDLSFDIMKKSNTATDNLHRKYKVRYSSDPKDE